MIVIASYNQTYIRDLLESLKDVKEKILVVCTSPDPMQLAYLHDMQEIYGVEVDCAPGTYATGAYLKAYRDHVDEEYFFIQDSMVLKDPKVFDKFRAAWREGDGCVAWQCFASFQANYDTEEQRKWIEAKYGTSVVPLGIFGPIFYTKRSVLEDMDKQDLFMTPTTKLEECGMERGWGIAIKKAGYTVNYLHAWNPSNIYADNFPDFKKIYAGRQ